MTAPDLLPCPFCGHAPELRNWVENDEVYCPTCTATGPLHNSSAEAIAAWNTRSMPAPAAMTPEVRADAEARFSEWFRKNYPGPDTVIHKPDWHSPKIFRAALAALREGGEG